MTSQTLIIRGRRVMVVRMRKFISAAPRMAALGWSRRRICAALRVAPDRVERVLAPGSGPSIWGELAGVVAREMRRAG